MQIYMWVKEHLHARLSSTRSRQVHLRQHPVFREHVREHTYIHTYIHTYKIYIIYVYISCIIHITNTTCMPSNPMPVLDKSTSVNTLLFASTYACIHTYIHTYKIYTIHVYISCIIHISISTCIPSSPMPVLDIHFRQHPVVREHVRVYTYIHTYNI